MTTTPKWIDYREMAVNALQKMSDTRITCMPVLNEKQEVVGSILTVSYTHLTLPTIA